jgi:thiol-disulfide isomerase/thioredoxin
MTIELHDAKKADDLLKSQEPVVIIYYADWCGHCREMKTVWEEFAKKTKTKVFKIESAEYPKQKSFPLLKIVKNGKIVKEVPGGGQTSDELTRLVSTSGGYNITQRNRSKRSIHRIRKLHRTFRFNMSLRKYLAASRKWIR